MSDLVRWYREYYREQTPASIDSLFAAMLDYDFSSYHEDMRKIFFMHREAKCMGGCDELRTNGSTSLDKRRYKFGPHFGSWKWKIEPHLRNLNLGLTIFLYCKPGIGPPEKEFRLHKVNHNSMKHYDVSGNFLEKQHIEDLFSFVVKLHEENEQRIIFSSFPDIWNIVIKNETFRELCLTHKEKISCFVNSDFEMFFTTDDFYVRDQMINWPSGVNFFVCERGQKHFFPSFFVSSSCVNLISLAKTYDDSDLVFLGQEPEICSCGTPRLPIEIRFHARNRILDAEGNHIDFGPLGRSLSGHYGAIQIHQDAKGFVTVYLNPHGELKNSDLEKMKSFFSDMKMRFEFNRYFYVGFKRYCFWRSESVKTSEFKLY